MTVKIAFAQQKGGTTKTSSVWNVSSYMAQKKKKRVLAIDMDMQANLTTSFGADPIELKKQHKSVYDLLTDQDKTAEEVIFETEQGVDLIGAISSLSLVEAGIKEQISREKILAKKLRPIAARYDYILFDTPPSFAITTLNAMAAADYLVCPIEPEPYCLDGNAGFDPHF